jgi:hypothetical protein
MKFTTPSVVGRHVAAAAVLLATLAAGMLAGTPAGVATPANTGLATPPAVPGVPDVGVPGEGTGRQTEPTIDPSGKPVWPTHVTQRAGWTEVVSVAAGARIRTRPITGTVIGLIPLGAHFWVSCQTRAADGYIWGYANHASRLGWVRKDLWEVVRYTAPGAPAPRPIPWC